MSCFLPQKWIRSWLRFHGPMDPWAHGPMGPWTHEVAPRSRTTKPITFFPTLSIVSMFSIYSHMSMVTFPIYPHMSRVNPPIYSLYVHGYPLTPIPILGLLHYEFGIEDSRRGSKIFCFISQNTFLGRIGSIWEMGGCSARQNKVHIDVRLFGFTKHLVFDPRRP